MKKTSLFALFLLIMSMTVSVAFAKPPTSPPGKVVTGGSFTCGTSDYSGTFVYTDPEAYYPQSFSWGGGYNTYGSQAREFFTDPNAKNITLEGSVNLKNMGEWVGTADGGDDSGDTSYFEVGLGCINGFYFPPEGYGSWPYDFKGPSCYIIIFGTSGGAGYSVHIQTQPGEYPGSGLVFPASLKNGVYEKTTFKYEMTIDIENEEIYLWAKQPDSDAQEITYTFDDFGWWYGLTDPANLPGSPVFAGMISADNQDAGHASISAIKLTEEL